MSRPLVCVPAFPLAIYISAREKFVETGLVNTNRGQNSPSHSISLFDFSVNRNDVNYVFWRSSGDNFDQNSRASLRSLGFKRTF